MSICLELAKARCGKVCIVSTVGSTIQEDCDCIYVPELDVVVDSSFTYISTCREDSRNGELDCKCIPIVSIAFAYLRQFLQGNTRQEDENV